MSEITLPKSNFNHVCYHDHEGRSFLRFVGRLPHQIVILPHFELQDLLALKINILDIPTDEKSRVSYKLNDCSPCLTKVEWKGRSAVDSYQLWTGHCWPARSSTFAERPWTRHPDASNGTSRNVRPYSAECKLSGVLLVNESSRTNIHPSYIPWSASRRPR